MNSPARQLAAMPATTRRTSSIGVFGITKQKKMILMLTKMSDYLYAESDCLDAISGLLPPVEHPQSEYLE